jgi:hypothetical protein
MGAAGEVTKSDKALDDTSSERKFSSAGEAE